MEDIDVIIINDFVKFMNTDLPKNIIADKAFKHGYENCYKYNEKLDKFLTEKNIKHINVNWYEYEYSKPHKQTLAKITSSEKIIREILKIATTIKKVIDGWNVNIMTKIIPGNDPTEVMTVELNKGKDKIVLKEYQGVVHIDWNVEQSKGQKIPRTIPISAFAGAIEVKKLDELLTSVGAPTWTKIDEIYEEEQLHS